MTRIYLVRHATHALIGKALAGRMPGVSLSSDGAAEAQRLAEHFANFEIAGILSSPIQRCRETAAPIADRLGLSVEIEPALDELDCGEWTGLSFDELAKDPRWHAWNSERGRAGMPGGETFAAVQARIMGLLERFQAEDHGPLLMVTHSDVVKVAVLSLLGASLDLHDRLEIAPASITTLDLWPGGGKLVRSNEAAP